MATRSDVQERTRERTCEENWHSALNEDTGGHVFTINRSLVILRPQQPFVDWVTNLPGPDPVAVEDVLADTTTVLIPEVDSEKEAWAYLERIAPRLFELELASWHTDPQDWPERDAATFRRWFAIELHSTILEPSANELVKEPSTQ